MIWAVFAALMLLSVTVVLPPLLRRRQAATDAGDLAVYRDQLREIDNDLERGLISAAEADAARVEIKRRILAVPVRAAEAGSAVPRRPLAIAVALVLCVFSAALYLTLGSPSLPGRPYDRAAARIARENADKDVVRRVDQMVVQLETRLKSSPNDAEGWRALGWIYTQMGRAKDGADALARAVALAPANVDLRSQYGEAVVEAADGKVTAEAAKIFDEVLARDPKDPRARFYRGLALTQAGKDQEALAVWLQLVREGPADAQWMPAVRQHASELALKLKLDPKTVLP